MTLRPLYTLASVGSEAVKVRLNKEAISTLVWRYHALEVMAPRPIVLPRSTARVRIYSDAEGNGGCAALFFFRNQQSPVLLKRRIPENAIASLNSQTCAIYILEMYAMVADLMELKPKGPLNVLVFLDNNSAALALIRGSAQDPTAHKLIKLWWRHIVSNSLYVWVERVSSAANPADAPSRGSNACIPVKYTKPLLPLPHTFLPWQKNKSFFSHAMNSYMGYGDLLGYLDIATSSIRSSTDLHRCVKDGLLRILATGNCTGARDSILDVSLAPFEQVEHNPDNCLGISVMLDELKKPRLDTITTPPRGEDITFLLALLIFNEGWVISEIDESAKQSLRKTAILALSRITGAWGGRG